MSEHEARDTARAAEHELEETNTASAKKEPAPADAHAQAASDMFSRLTPWYDLQNHAFSLGLDFWWRRHLVRAVVPGPARKVLDLAAGIHRNPPPASRRHEKNGCSKNYGGSSKNPHG